MSLQITAAAMTLIRERLSRSEIPDPVVRFVEQSEPIRVSATQARRILEATAVDRVSVGDIPTRADELGQIQMRFVPAVYRREQVFRWQLKRIGDVTFVVTFAMRFLRREIDVGAGCLILRDGDGKTLLPQKRQLPRV